MRLTDNAEYYTTIARHSTYLHNQNQSGLVFKLRTTQGMRPTDTGDITPTDSTYLHDQSGLVPGRLAPLVGVDDDLWVVTAYPRGLLLRLDQPSPFRRGLVPHPQDVHAEAACTARSRA